MLPMRDEKRRKKKERAHFCVRKMYLKNNVRKKGGGFCLKIGGWKQVRQQMKVSHALDS